ncbi:hypothetical protein [Clostridium sp. DSM 8431]|uniref:hypothetical protein n=1 Tax=Clostridium sp. DSM 8431 TaxID=1761781 RepID=UPI000B7D0D4E|nr:hypothetical protein [Clostridium sp. DSM 8431]
MNYKIIYNDKNIEFTNSCLALAFSGDTDKNFYRVDNDIVEVCYLDINNINESRDLKDKYKTIFILINFIKSDEVEKIYSLLNYNNVIVASINKDSSIIKDDKVISLKGFNKKISIEALIKMFSNKEILMKIKNREVSSSIVIGNESMENHIEKILENLIRNFTHIENYKEYIMYLCANEEFNIAEVAYLEDLMNEYLYKADKIKIQQFKNGEIKDNVLYSILAIK